MIAVQRLQYNDCNDMWRVATVRAGYSTLSAVEHHFRVGLFCKRDLCLYLCHCSHIECSRAPFPHCTAESNSLFASRLLCSQPILLLAFWLFLLQNIVSLVGLFCKRDLCLYLCHCSHNECSRAPLPHRPRRTTAAMRGGGLGSRPEKMYGEYLRDGVEYHLMSPTPRR